MPRFTKEQKEALNRAYISMSENDSPAVINVRHYWLFFLYLINFPLPDNQHDYIRKYSGNFVTNKAMLPIKQGHRKKIFNDVETEKIKRMHNEGVSKRNIAKCMGVSHPTIIKYLRGAAHEKDSD